MVYRKGELTKARVLVEWPHHVWTPQRPNGFGQLLDVMHGFCRGRDYQTAGPGNRAAVDGIWWCFKRADDADAFCAWLRERGLRGGEVSSVSPVPSAERSDRAERSEG